MTFTQTTNISLNPRSARRVVALVAIFALGLAVTLSAPNASANGLTLAVEVGPEYVVSPKDDDLEHFGLGFAGRVGYTFSSPLVSLTPEAKFGFQSPGGPHSFIMSGGARINFFKVVSPAIFAHAGGLIGDMSGFVWDAGLGLDLVVIPALDLGIFCSYSQVGKANFTGTQFYYHSSNWQWVQFGAQAAVHF